MSTDVSAAGEWLSEAVAAVDDAIDELLDQFLRDPFAHRVEHSLHVQLYNLLITKAPLAGRYEIGTSGYWTGLVHKEWPGGTRKSTKTDRSRRVSYDLAVLDPGTLAATTLDDFDHGNPTTAIAIELGLNYSSKHLRGDLEKFATDSVDRGYIVHFSRRRTRRREDVENLLRDAPGSVQSVLAHLDVADGNYRIKRRTDTAVIEQRYAPLR